MMINGILYGMMDVCANDQQQQPLCGVLPVM